MLMVTGSFAESLIQPLHPVGGVDRQKAKLGRMLFFDPTLSRDSTISCASCHKADRGWADERVVSLGVYGRKGRVNSPTVLNAVYNFKQFYNGRADTLKEQAKGPLHEAFEMDMDDALLQERLQANSEYKKLFHALYKDGITVDNVVDVIAEFEKRLTTSNAKFDRYLKSEATLTQEEKQGYKLFRVYGCITCHNGMNVGGNSFQKLGIVIAYENCYDDRFAITKRTFDKCVYKVPTLRNIEKTAPYFHDGSAKTLREAIKKMAYHNLGFELEDDDIKSIEAFLKTLSAELDPEVLND